MSRDAQRLEELSRLLGIYRLAFGQPRQDELLGALQRVPDLDGRLHELLIDLSPASGAARRMSSQLTQRGFDLVERGWWL